MNKRILVIYGESQYSVLRVATDLVIKGFEKRGYTVDTYDVDEDNKLEHMAEYLLRGYAFIFSMQALLYNLRNEEGTHIISLVDSVWFGWIVDDILYHLHKVMSNRYKNTYVLGVDNRMKENARLMFPDMSNVVTLFHGGFEYKEKVDNKDIDILFSGTGAGINKWEEFAEDAVPVETFLVQETIKVLNSNPRIAVRTALKQVVEQIGEEFSTDLVNELSRAIIYLDKYVRYQCRTKILNCLLESGLHVHILGNGYEETAKKYPDQITYYGSVEIEKVTELMARSKIVMNPFPPIFEQGYHERIFSSMLCKSICFTPDFNFARETLGDRLEYIDLNNLDQMISDIKRVLDNYDQQQERLEDNYQYALANHTWEKRGEELIDIYESLS